MTQKPASVEMIVRQLQQQDPNVTIDNYQSHPNYETVFKVNESRKKLLTMAQFSLPQNSTPPIMARTIQSIPVPQEKKVQPPQPPDSQSFNLPGQPL